MRTFAASALLILLSSVSACTTTTVGTGSGNGGPQASSNGSDTTTGTSDPRYAALFDAPASETTTPDSIYGVWAGSASGDDVRIEFSPTEVTVALKCDSATIVGATASADVTSRAIRVRQSVDAISRSGACRLELRPSELPSCADNLGSGACFTLSGTRLDLGDGPLFGSYQVSLYNTLTKVSD